MANSEINLLELFQSISSALTQNQTALNNADTYNHDHGDHMVEVFDLITQVAKKNSDQPVAEQLAKAGKMLQSKGTSGSAAAYAEGLGRAAQQFQGRSLTAENAIELVQSLMGSQTPATQSQGNQAGGLLGGLLQQVTNPEQGGLDAGDLLQVGMAFLQSKQQGESTLEALMDAVVAGSQMAQTPHREQSGRLITETLMQVIGNVRK
jgi:hypothetical protein